MLVSSAMRAGFSGGLVVDFPHSTRAKKYFLVLMVGTSTHVPQVRVCSVHTHASQCRCGRDFVGGFALLLFYRVFFLMLMVGTCTHVPQLRDPPPAGRRGAARNGSGGCCKDQVVSEFAAS